MRRFLFLLIHTVILFMRVAAVRADIVTLSTESIVTLEKCIQIGVENYEPLKLAEEEVELARLKRQEAYRSFYPSVSLKIEETNGETTDITKSPDFTERQYGASISEDVISGGKISSVYQQSVASHRAAKNSREKTWQDFVYSVREAYWKLVSAEFNVTQRNVVRDQIKTDLKMITEQYVLDLTVKKDFLSVKSQYLQANSQANSAAVALSKARWNLAKALGLHKPPTFQVVSDIPYQKIETNLAENLALAAGHRPDLVMQDDLVEVSKRAQQIAESAHYPKLTLNGFYGRSASAFETDPLIYRDDWQVNARVSQSFFGNSLALSSSKINTSPKIGQSTRTKSTTKGASLNLLDGMRDRTEIKQAGLGYRQAVVKRDDLRKDAALDVEESYYNLSQSQLQVDFSEEDMKLAEEEFRVAESKGKYGLSSILELAQARNRLATSRSSRIDALASYQIALAALNRAVGIVDKFK